MSHSRLVARLTVLLLAGVSLIGFAWPPLADAASITVDGAPFFDDSLGTLTRAVVTVDPMRRSLGGAVIVSPPDEFSLDEHQHTYTFPTLPLAGKDVVFTPALSEWSTDPADSVAREYFDPAPVTVTYRGAELHPFLNTTPPPLAGSPPDSLVRRIQSVSHDTVQGHWHLTTPFYFSFAEEASTTFEYAAVPESSTCGTALLAVLLAAGVSRPQRRCSIARQGNSHTGATLLG